MVNYGCRIINAAKRKLKLKRKGMRGERARLLFLSQMLKYLLPWSLIGNIF